MPCRLGGGFGGRFRPGPGPVAVRQWAQLPPTQAIDAPVTDRLFGDWNGLRTDLMGQGVNFQLYAVTEFAGDVAGGTRQGATFANHNAFRNDINRERLADATGLSTHVIIVNRSG